MCSSLLNQDVHPISTDGRVIMGCALSPAGAHTVGPVKLRTRGLALATILQPTPAALEARPCRHSIPAALLAWPHAIRPMWAAEENKAVLVQLAAGHRLSQLLLQTACHRLWS